MRIIFAGGFENSLMRGMSSASNTILEGHSYYDSLYRMRPKEYFDRIGTLLAISNEALLPPVDWVPSNSTKERISNPSLNEVGVRRRDFDGDEKDKRDHSFHEWDRETQLFLGMVLSRNGISTTNLEKINSGLPSAKDAERLEIGDMGEFDYSTIHYLSRLLIQLREAAATKSILVICDDDKAVLSEIGKFVALHRTPTPFDLPDMDSVTTVDGLDFAGGILNFCPHDAFSIAAIREDKDVIVYAEKVRSIVSNLNPREHKLALLNAMRDAYGNARISSRVEKIFEIQSMIAKPLHYIPGLDAGLTILEDGIDIAKRWITRKRTSDEWCLLSVKMTDISVRDYLRRTNNQ